MPAVPGRLRRGAPSLLRGADLDSASGLGEPAVAVAGGWEGRADHANQGRVFSLPLLSSPFLPDPDSGAFIFQVGSYFHLQVSDKCAHTTPIPLPGPDGRGGGVELSGQRLGLCTQAWGLVQLGVTLVWVLDA